MTVLFAIAYRFWLSTCCYALATECHVPSLLPAAGSALYEWPRDLAKPDAVLLLTVNEENRRARLQNRLKEEEEIETEEELQLEKNQVFREW